MNIWNSLSDYTDRRAKSARYYRYLAEPKPEEKEATPPPPVALICYEIALALNPPTKFYPFKNHPNN